MLSLIGGVYRWPLVARRYVDQRIALETACIPRFTHSVRLGGLLHGELDCDSIAPTQTRNGIYSGIFFAVMMADAFAHGDPVKAIDTAEQYFPPKSRFAEMIRFIQARCAAEGDWQKVNAAILEKYPHEAKRFNHCLPNAAIVLLGLLKGEGDFTRTLGTTVMAGLDTDCTGATVGSIMGCALGTAGIPAHWTDPLNDTIKTQLPGMHELKISEVARRMYEAAKGNARYDRD